MPAGGRSKIDYVEAERRYVVEGQSVRQIARDMGLRSWSSMNSIAQRDDWKGKRQAYLSAIARRSYETAAATVAQEGQVVRDEAVLAGRATIRQYLSQLQAGKVTVSPKDAQMWAAFLISEMSPGPKDTSSEVPDVRNVTPPDTDLLRRVVEAARQRVSPAGSLGSAPLVESSDPRPN
jgi:hypothetical protein